jgi:uncharacterized protein (TIGR02118 family)
MAGAKLVVLYPYPADVEVFEKDYTQEHMPLVSAETMPGMTKFIGTRFIGTADGSPPPFYRMAELHFPSLEALQAAASSTGAQTAVAHAIEISSGGLPHFLVAEDETIEF